MVSPSGRQYFTFGRTDPILAELRASGVTTLHGIAAALNERGIPTASGAGRWQATSVSRLLARLPTNGPSEPVSIAAT
jgi:hypothetical protein